MINLTENQCDNHFWINTQKEKIKCQNKANNAFFLDIGRITLWFCTNMCKDMYISNIKKIEREEKKHNKIKKEIAKKQKSIIIQKRSLTPEIKEEYDLILKKCYEYLNNKCDKCGKNTKLQFHYYNSNIKSICIEDKLHKGFDYLKSELDKCFLLCRKCHLLVYKENPHDLNYVWNIKVFALKINKELDVSEQILINFLNSVQLTIEKLKPNLLNDLFEYAKQSDLNVQQSTLNVQQSTLNKKCGHSLENNH